MKKTLIITLLCVFCLNSYGRNWYFSPTGSDAGLGTIGSPYQTITKLNAITVASGDSVLFQRGGTFSGQITVATGVKYDAYGTGQKPLITGFSTLSSWTSAGGGIYYATDLNLPTDVSLVTFNGVVQTRGRYPRTTYLTYTTHTANTSITGPVLPFSITPNLSQVVIRKTHFNMDRGTITAQAGGQLTYTGTSTVQPSNNYGFFVTNDLNTLTTLGDWAYDNSTHRLYFYFGGGGPTGTVKASRYTFNMQFATKTNVSVKNLQFEGANTTSVGGTGNNLNFTFINNTIVNSGGDGLLFQGSNGVIARLDTFKDCMNQAAIILYTNGSRFNRNVCLRSGAIAGAGANGYGVTGWGAYGAVTVGAADPALSFNNHIDSNVVINAGYLGLHVNGDSFTCNYNRVDTTNYILDDGAGLYSYTGPPGYTYAGRTIANNVVSNSLGAVAGTDGAFGNQGSAIYLDDGSSQVTVSNNTGFNCGRYGLYLHNAFDITVTGNTFYNNAMAQLSMGHDNIYVAGKLANITLSGNKNIAMAGQLNLQFQSTASNSGPTDITTWGTASNNRYATTGATTFLFTVNVTGLGASSKTFLMWASQTGQESLSAASVQTLPQILIELNGTLATLNATLPSNYDDLYGVAYPAGLLSMSSMSSYYLIFNSTPPPPAVPVITYPSPQTYTYGQTISPISPTNTGGATISYSVSPALPSGLGLNIGSGVISGTATGAVTTATYTVTASNGAGSGTFPLIITVNKAAVVVTANGVSKVYGTAITGGSGSTAFTSSGLLFGQTIGSVSIAYGSGSAANAAVAVYGSSVTPSSAVGGSFNSANYQITYVPASITVTQKALSITATGIANKPYGTNLTAQSSNQFTAVGAISGESVTSVTLNPSGLGTLPLADVGTPYTSTPSGAVGSGGFLASNYSVSYVDYAGSVAKAPLTITADNKTKVTLAPNPTLSVHYTGFQNGQDNTVLTAQPVIVTTAVLGSPVGTYPITASSASALNYTISYVAGVMTVTSVPVPPTPSKFKFVLVYRNGRWQWALLKK